MSRAIKTKREFPIFFAGITADYKIEREGKRYRIWFATGDEGKDAWLKGEVLTNLDAVDDMVKTISDGMEASFRMKRANWQAVQHLDAVMETSFKTKRANLCA